MEIFGTINTAEAEARKIRMDAENAAAEAKELAISEGKANVSVAIAAAKQEVELIAKATAQDAEKSSIDLSRTTDNRKAILRDRVERKLNSAADFIVESVVNG